MTKHSSEPHLEPRVAKLEVGMERLTQDIQTLSNSVHELGGKMENEISKLTVAVTQAQSPKRTDWGTLIAAVMMIITIGAAVLIPLNQTAQENKDAINKAHEIVADHAKMDSHPVGLALIQRLEAQIAMHAANNEKAFKDHADHDVKEIDTVRTHFHEEIDLLNKQYMIAMTALENKVNLHNDRIYARVVKIEDTIAHDRNSELNELRLWRLRAMNDEIKSVVPIGNAVIFDPHVPTKEEGKTGAIP